MHGNSGVVNYWFYLLSEGGNGTNDLPHSDTYDVQGIGTEKAGLIAFYIMMYYLTDDDDFEKARASSILAAQALFGPCSNEEIQTTNAWYAVGVGDVSACPPITSQDPAHAKLEPIMIFPNPSSGKFLVEFSDIQEFQSLEVFDLMGTKIRSYSLTTSNQIEVDLSSYASGIFIAKIQEKLGQDHFNWLSNEIEVLFFSKISHCDRPSIGDHSGISPKSRLSKREKAKKQYFGSHFFPSRVLRRLSHRTKALAIWTEVDKFGIRLGI